MKELQYRVDSPPPVDKLAHGAGDLVRLVFEEEGRPVALMMWAAACYCLKARDERIGWNPAMRASGWEEVDSLIDAFGRDEGG